MFKCLEFLFSIELHVIKGSSLNQVFCVRCAQQQNITNDSRLRSVICDTKRPLPMFGFIISACCVRFCVFELASPSANTGHSLPQGKFVKNFNFPFQGRNEIIFFATQEV